MTRDKLVRLKAEAFDRMQLCYSVFIGNKPPGSEHAQELQGHAAFYQSLCAELGEPLDRTQFESIQELCVSAKNIVKRIVAEGHPHTNDLLFVISALDGIVRKAGGHG